MEKNPCNIILNSEFFDKEFYTKNYPIPADIDPSEHYLLHGWKLCYDPSDSFSTSGYLYKNPDVLKEGINPLFHYETSGKNEERKQISTKQLAASEGIFNPFYYIHTYLNDDPGLSEEDAVSDYLTRGWKNAFSVDADNTLKEYLDKLPESEKGCIPLLHYIIFECAAKDKKAVNDFSRAVKVIENSQYFDEEYYRAAYNIGEKTDAARHYFEFGSKMFYDPSKEFSTSGYFYKNKDVYKKHVNPLYHYELHGKKEGRSWITTKKLLKDTELFDTKFYCAKYLFEYLDEKKYEQWAIDDFIRYGSTDRRLPNKDFKPEENRDVFAAFMETVLADTKSTNDSIAREKHPLAIIKSSNLFDEEWYKERYSLSDYTNGAEHYLNIGWKLMYDPSLKFCTEDYIDMYGSELSEEINPLLHYELYGRNKKYQPLSLVHNTIRQSGLFDSDWYSENYMTDDIFRNPIVHYIKEGASVGYPPSPHFNTARYLINGRDVLDSGMNPLYHYIKYGKGKRDVYALFKLDDSVCSYDKAVQDLNIEQDYDRETKSLVLFLLPTSDSIGGGVMSINSIAKVTLELTKTIKQLKGYKVILASYPSSYTFSKYTKFECPFNIYRFNMLRDYFTSVKNMIIHIPEVMTANFIAQMSPCDAAWLHNIPNLKINILNQNNDMMIRPLYASFLKSLTDNLTITCAHRKYCTPNQRSSYSMPVHMLSTSNLVTYKYKPYGEKENLLLYSPDKNDTKPAILEKIMESFPDLQIKMIQNIEYSEYLELISRAKWMITFGEGLDGYAMESIRSGAISFAVFNHTFFNERFEGLPNIYNSYQDMLLNIVDDMKKLDAPENYKALNDTLRQKDAEEKDEIRYRNNIKNYYLGNYTYPIDEILIERKKRMDSKPLVSIVMATYNGEKYLHKQLESICNLTYDNFELIISDDGSTDDTLSIIEQFTDRLDISLYHNQGSHGATGNFENGLNHINGEYVAFCDQDDIWVPDHIEKLLYQIDDFDIIHGRLKVIDEKSNYHPASVMHSSYEISKAQYITVEDYLDVPRLLGCASLIRASAIKKCLPFPEEAPYHDWWITLKCIIDGNGICFTDELVIEYRQHGENTAYSEYQSGTRIQRQYDFMRFLKKEYNNKLTKHQLDIIERVENWCLLYPIFKGAANKGMDPYFSAHRTDFSNDVIEQIITAYNNK